MESPGNRRGIPGMIAVAIRFRAPDMNLVDGANGPALNELHDAAIVAAGVDLGAHLRDALVPGSGLGDKPRLGDGVG